MPKYAWIVVVVAVLGFVTSLTIHITAYYQFIDMDFFLLYCRAEWVLAALLGILLGLLMPSTQPKRQARMLMRWMLLGCTLLVAYTVYGGYLYTHAEHPRHLRFPENRYVVQFRGETIRRITHQEYMSLATAEHKQYVMYVNRAFSILWVALFLGISTHGVVYLWELRRGKHYLIPPDQLSSERFVPWWYGGI